MDSEQTDRPFSTDVERWAHAQRNVEMWALFTRLRAALAGAGRAAASVAAPVEGRSLHGR